MQAVFLGGISDGSPIIVRAHIKPTPSVFSPQETVNKNGENILVRIKGRHDPVIVPRAVVVVEAMTASHSRRSAFCRYALPHGGSAQVLWLSVRTGLMEVHYEM